MRRPIATDVSRSVVRMCVCCVCVQLVAVLREVKYLLMRNMEEIPRGVRQHH